MSNSPIVPDASFFHPGPGGRAAFTRSGRSRARYLSGCRTCSVETGPVAAERAVRGPPRSDRVHEARAGRVREEQRALEVRRQAALALEQVRRLELGERLAPSDDSAGEKASEVVDHRDGRGSLDQRRARGPMVVEASLETEIEVLVLERVRELVRERDLALGALAGPGDEGHLLLLVVVEAGDLLAEDRPGELAQVGALRAAARASSGPPRRPRDARAGTPRRGRASPSSRACSALIVRTGGMRLNSSSRTRSRRRATRSTSTAGVRPLRGSASSSSPPPVSTPTPNSAAIMRMMSVSGFRLEARRGRPRAQPRRRPRA